MLATITFLSCFLMSVVAARDPLTITIAQGTLIGTMLPSTIPSKPPGKAWLGIPFGQTNASVRFQAAAFAPSWGPSPRNASTFGPACPQQDVAGIYGPQNEDCLNLNIYAPQVQGDSLLPVMVWIYGGSFEHGGNALPLYNGVNLANDGNVIVVAVNYRIGALGFGATTAIGDDAMTGNYGLLDQRLGLKWVQQNIGAFGGDAANVTIFGESAGSMSICFHLVSPGSWPYFGRVIMESGSCLQGQKGPRQPPAPYSIEGATKQMSNLLQALHCKTLACLQATSVSDLITAQNSLDAAYSLGWSPVVDGTIIPADPLTLAASGRMAPDVTIMLGMNTNEGTMFSLPWNATDFDYRAILDVEFGTAVGAQIYAQYPTASYNNNASYAFAAAAGDYFFWCPGLRLASLASGASRGVYVYHFDHVPSWEPVLPLKVAHTYEIPFVFGNPGDYFVRTFGSFTPEEDVLSHEMGDFWTSFAKSGAPSSPRSNVAWPTYDEKRQMMMFSVPTIGVQTDYKAKHCAFWDNLTPIQH